MSAHMKQPLPTGFGEAVARLKELASQSAHSLLTEGPVNPDWELLDLCSDIGHHRKALEEASGALRSGWVPAYAVKTEAQRIEQRRLQEDRDSADQNMSHLLRRASKMKATSAAGIFAKAMAVRSSKGGAALLGVSLAEDLLACPGLREALWPAQGGG